MGKNKSEFIKNLKLTKPESMEYQVNLVTEKDKIKFIKELAESMNANKIDTVKYEENDFEIQITKKEKERKVFSYGGVPTAVAAEQPAVTVGAVESETPVQETAQVEEISGTKITSPMVGTYYSAPSPTSAPFIKEGDSVSEGQTLCIVEAMKLMNEVKSSVSGKVKKILVKDGEAIKKGQDLIIIE